MMGARGSFFLQVYLRNAASQRRKQERGEQGRAQNIPLQSPEPSRNLDSLPHDLGQKCMQEGCAGSAVRLLRNSRR